jgi:arylsulfatase A-like enzyme
MTLSRRDFLKITGAAAAGVLMPEHLLASTPKNNRPNIIIVLCDSLSALNMSLHGYRRQTTPNLEKFAQRSTVYNNHYSGGNFTTTGTASMLTGMWAWKHRAINFGGLVQAQYANINPYSLLSEEYHKLAFSQNIWPYRLLGQYHGEINRFLSPSSYSLLNPGAADEFFHNDPVISALAVNEYMLSAQGVSPAGSSFLGSLYKSYFLSKIKNMSNVRYPNGLPEVEMSDGYIIPYRNEFLFDGIYSEVKDLDLRSSPFFSYFHLYSPHSPYRPRFDYQKLFKDGYKPTPKPKHHFSENLPEDIMLTQRTLYDRQVAQLDDEFGRLVSRLDENGILDRSYLIFTSDHGELFERGYVGHGNELMYESVLRIPLMIHAPGQSERKDVTSRTSNVDLLPTILSIAGEDLQSSLDGRVLPGFGGTADLDRPIFSILAKENSAFAKMTKAVISMHKGVYKLIAYLKYDIEDAFELYDLENDPEELTNLAMENSKIFISMKDELFAHLASANQPYARSK